MNFYELEYALNNHEHVLNIYIDHIYVLYISPCEVYHIKNILNQKKIKAEFFMGVNGSIELFDEYTDYLNNSNTKLIKTIGAFGHLHSFINIMKDAISHNYKNIMVIESDVYFHHKFDSLVESYLKMDYKLLYLGASQHDWSGIEIKSDQNFYKASKTCGTFGIVIESSIYHEYLNLLLEKRIPSDIALFTIQEKYNNCIVTYPNLICCDVTKSTTSGRRVQIDMMTKFRWQNHYNFDNEYHYELKQNTVYKIEIKINSYLRSFHGQQYLIIKNKGQEDNKIIIKNNDKYDFEYIYKTVSSVLNIKTMNLFIDDIDITELNSHLD